MGSKKYNIQTKEWISSYYRNDKNKDIIGYEIDCLMKDKNEKLWIATPDGLSVLDVNSVKFSNYWNVADDHYSLPSNIIRFIYQDDEGLIWIGTRKGGIDKYDIYSNRFSHYYHIPNSKNSINHNKVSFFCDGGNGRIWISTDGGGLNQFNLSTKEFSQIPSS